MSTHSTPPPATQSTLGYHEREQIRANDTSSPRLQLDNQDSVSLLSSSLSQEEDGQTQDLHRLESIDIDRSDGYRNETTPAVASTSANIQAAATSSRASSTIASHNDVKEHKTGWLSKLRGRFTAMLPPKRKQSPSTPKPPNRIKKWLQSHRYLNIWWWEILCCVFALAALIAIVVTVRAHEHKPLPKWQYGLTVNAMIAAYTVILKAAAGLVLAEGISHLKWIAVARPQSLSSFVAHDNASRGPLGALKLLWKNQYRSGGLHMTPFISSLGALITILVLLVDPFSQQIIKTYECERRVIGEYGNIARTNSYTEAGKHSGAGEATIPLSVRGAVNNGMFASRKPDVEFVCRTGNCSFTEEYATLAFCSSCMDVTDELKFVQYDGYDDIFNQTTPYTNVSLTIDDRRTLTLSRGGSAMSRGYLGLVSHFDSELNMIRWDGLMATPEQNQTIKGYRCRLYPCIKTFKAYVRTGRIAEEEVEASGDVFSSVITRTNRALRVAADLKCLDDPRQADVLHKLGYEFNETTRWLPYNVSWTNGTMEHPVLEPSMYYNPCERAPANQHADLCNGNKTSTKALEVIPAHCIYNIGQITTTSLSDNLFSQMFTGYIRNSWTYGYAGYEGTEALTALYNGGSGNGTLKDVEGMLKNMTDGLTTYMRQADSAVESYRALGDMYNYTSCIEVRWAWLSYAAMIVGSLLIFFIWMVVYARRDQSRLRRQWKDEDSVPLIHDFKSSALDFLFHGMDAETLRHMANMGATNQTGELEKRAEKVMVALIATEQGWKLSSAAS